jgi:hypothetical protein
MICTGVYVKLYALVTSALDVSAVVDLPTAVT